MHDADNGADSQHRSRWSLRAYRLEPWTSATVTSGILAIVLLAAVVFMPVPFSVMSPGPVFNTLGEVDGEPMISFGSGTKTYPDTKGELNFTTVSVTRAETDVSLVRIASELLGGHSLIIPHDQLYPDAQSNEQSSKQEAAELQSSQDASAVAALRATGRTVAEQVKVGEVQEGAPADGVLQSGDVLLAVDGRQVADSAALIEAISGHTPGSTVELLIERDGSQQTVTVGTVAAADDPSVARVGVVLDVSYDMPIEVKNNIGDRIGGPSAGTMFALSIYDQLTPGSLTGGARIAGTGTVTPEGQVGVIGGVQQKMAGAQRAGSTIFLLPTANCDEATQVSTTMKLIPVDTLDEAISDLEALAADPHAKVAQCPRDK